MSVWGKRECLTCKKGFEAKYASQVTCSVGCQKKRKNELMKIYRKKTKATFEYLQLQVKEKDALIEALQKEIKSLKAELKKAGKDGYGKNAKAIQDFQASHELKTCERMKLKALNLPCGERDQCWQPSKCEKNTHSARPESIARSTARIQHDEKTLEELP